MDVGQKYATAVPRYVTSQWSNIPCYEKAESGASVSHHSTVVPLLCDHL